MPGALLALGLCSGCGRPPPPSQFPTADAALGRMHASYSCSRGVQGEAKLDLFNKQGRVRGNVLVPGDAARKPPLHVYSPFGVTLSTLTSDGQNFSLFDLQNKQFLYGPANTCNVERFTQVPVPPFALVELLRGEAPVLVHQPSQATIAWDGEYVIRIQSRHQANGGDPPRADVRPTGTCRGRSSACACWKSPSRSRASICTGR